MGAVNYAFIMSAHLTSNLFNSTISRHMRTESLATTEMYVIEDGVSVLCPSPTTPDLTPKVFAHFNVEDKLCSNRFIPF